MGVAIDKANGGLTIEGIGADLYMQPPIRRTVTANGDVILTDSVGPFQVAVTDIDTIGGEAPGEDTDAIKGQIDTLLGSLLPATS